MTLTATVTAGATGTVTFEDGATSLGTGTIASGVATLTVSTLSVGTHPITASYGGDSNYTTAVSTPVSQVVNKASSTVALASLPNPSTFGARCYLHRHRSRPGATRDGHLRRRRDITGHGPDRERCGHPDGQHAGSGRPLHHRAVRRRQQLHHCRLHGGIPGGEQGLQHRRSDLLARPSTFGASVTQLTATVTSGSNRNSHIRGRRNVAGHGHDRERRGHPDDQYAGRGHPLDHGELWRRHQLHHCRLNGRIPGGEQGLQHRRSDLLTQPLDLRRQVLTFTATTVTARSHGHGHLRG